MKRIISMATIAAAVVGPLFATTPAHAACALSAPNPVYRYYVCTDGNCRVDVLGDRVVTCP